MKRDSVTRFFSSGFFHYSSSPGPLLVPWEPFRFFQKFSKIFGYQGALPAMLTTVSILGFLHVAWVVPYQRRALFPNTYCNTEAHHACHIYGYSCPYDLYSSLSFLPTTGSGVQSKVSIMCLGMPDSMGHIHPLLPVHGWNLVHGCQTQG